MDDSRPRRIDSLQPKDIASDWERFSNLTRVYASEALKRFALFTALLAAGLALFYLVWPEAFPWPDSMLKAMNRTSRREMSGFELLQAVIGFVVLFFASIGYSSIFLIYKEALRYRCIARYCMAAGLDYALDDQSYETFAAHQFKKLRLVPDHTRVALDDMIFAPRGRRDLVFAEARLYRRTIWSKFDDTVFRGALLYLDLAPLAHGVDPPSLRCRTYSKVGNERWVAPDSLALELPNHGVLLSRIAELAEVLEAKSIAVAMERGVLFVAIPHPRDSFPVPRVWMRRRDTETFKQIGVDLAALAALASELPSSVSVAPFQDELPRRLRGNYSVWPEGKGLKLLVILVVLVVVGVAIRIAIGR